MNLPPPARPAPWGLRAEVALGLAVLVVWAVGVWLRTVELGSTSLDQAAIHPHFYATLMASGESWPGAGPPAAFFLRHGALNAWVLTLFQPFGDSLSDSVRVAAVLRSLAIPLLYLLGRALGAPAWGLALAAVRAVAPDTVNLDRHFGGTYFLDPVLLATMWGLAAGQRAGALRLAATGVGLACLPLVHPMGFPAALGLGLGWAMLVGGRPERGRIALAALVPLVPYAWVELGSHLGGVRSVLAMLTGGVEFEAPGEEDVGLVWTLRLLLKDPGPWTLTVPALIALLAAPALVGVLLARRDLRDRIGVPALSYAAGGAGLLVFLQVVQGGVGYGYGHHVMSAFLLAAGLLGALWGRLVSLEHRGRSELIAGAVLVLAVTPFLPRMAMDSEGAARSWPWGMSALGSIEEMAALIDRERGGPVHLALVHAPDAQPAPPVALSAVVVALMQRGVPLSAFPQYPPAEPVEGWFVLVGEGADIAPPGELMAYRDPHPQAGVMRVRVWRSDDFMTLKGWMDALPEGYELYGTEEYQDLQEYYFARPAWPGRGGALPLLDSPYRSSDW